MGCGASKKSKVDAGFTATRGGRKPPLAELRAQHLPSPAEKHDPDAAAPGKKFLRSGASLKRVIEQNSVLVVARVRPLNQREGKSAVCVEVTSAASLTIAEGKDGAGTADRQFTFDACFRSDASQEDVYSRSGRMVLGKVLDGFNGCVFAYGQTGSGKTFTMQGSKEEPGIIPRICAELFERIATLSEKRYAVEIAMCEIYNEKLNDLLVSGGDGSRDLAIREEAGGRGVFVEGLSSYAVGSASEIQAMIDAGQKRRAVGRTNMNEHSSRSHSVITLKVTSCDASDSERVTEVECKLHLIDLAGSERQKATGATGDRLKEGAQINLSLSALGNVINALTDQKKKGGHVPYRDSKLTRLLSDSLGGNSVTVMLCNVSPAQLNAEETLSALRFAERAKKLENTATVARDSKAAKAAALFAENKALKERVAQLEAYVAALEQLY
ncbi:hypothetical protein AB1Y20_013057 [Prymnesium parvum]|uniref:Kinesin motor domain-containing protein n=1 Tax=Prymnesium parvum TaxID=97485 RepID=A0AB34IK59_PRYPA